MHWRAVRGSHVRIVVDSALMTYQVARITRRRPSQRLAALEAWHRSPDAVTGADAAALAAAVTAQLPVPAPVVPSEKGVLVLLPFVEAVDASDLAEVVEQNLEGILVRPTTVDAGALLDPSNHRLRSALAAT